jgi:hypothetical protein
MTYESGGTEKGEGEGGREREREEKKRNGQDRTAFINSK